MSALQMTAAPSAELPSPTVMAAFARSYTKEQWNKLCASQDFLDTFTIDIVRAKKIAEALLKKP